MRIKPSKKLFRELEARFLAGGDDTQLEDLVSKVASRGHLTRPELLRVARWKSPRATPLVARCTELEVAEATGLALRSGAERLRITSLLMLPGVSWPTASVVLHYFHSDPYPVIDFRAVWSLGMPPRSAYTFEFWWQYVELCRGLSRSLGLSMRTVDRALWQYSKERS